MIMAKNFGIAYSIEVFNDDILENKRLNITP
jgi:hypothetical protein